MFVLSGSQELSQLSNAAGLVSGGNSAPEITLTINNSSLTQALAQTSAAASTPATSTPEITLTIAGTHTLVQTIHTQTAALSVDNAVQVKHPNKPIPKVTQHYTLFLTCNFDAVMC